MGSILRPVDRSDLDNVHAWHNDRNLCRNTFGFILPSSKEAVSRWYDQNIAGGDSRNAIFGIVNADSPAAICGLVMLRDISWVHRSASFGIFLGEDGNRGKGIGSRAVSAILDYGFNDLGLHRVALEVSAENLGAIRLYERFGFKREGILREAKFIDGTYINVLVMGLLAAERA